jgi:hypothetical protein
MGRTRHGSRLRTIGLLMVLATGCSKSTPVEDVGVIAPNVRPSTVFTTEPAATEPIATDASPVTSALETTTTTTTPPTTTTESATTTTTTTRVVDAPKEITDPKAVIDAALLSLDQRREQISLPASKRSKAALSAATSSYADGLLASFLAYDATNRREAKGTIDDRVPLRIEENPKTGVVVLLCTRNNGRELDTKGTATESDDTLVQEDLAIRQQRIEMVFQNGRWLANGHKKLEAGECSTVFS